MTIQKLIHSLLALGTMALAALVFGAGLATAQPDASGRISPMTDVPASAQVVTVGLYVNTVYQLEVSSSTYYLDAYMWFKWKGDIDPTATMELTNMVEEWGAMVTPLNEEPQILADGSSYTLMKVEGRFMQPFQLGDYPLDHQKLSIYIEDNTYGSDQLVYVLDEVESGYGHLLAIPGWKIDNWSWQALAHDYGTFFGAESAGGASVYSTLRFDLEISRPVNFFVWKLMLPLVILLMASWMVLVIDPRLVEVRTALPATGLLTAVFLQQAYSDSLPEVGYLVLIDKIYAVAYAMIIATLLRAIWTARATNSDAPGEVAALRKTDRQLLIGQVALFAAAIAVIVLAR